MSASRSQIQGQKTFLKKITSFLAGWLFGFGMFIALFALLLALVKVIFPSGLKGYALVELCSAIALLWLVQVVLARGSWQKNRFYAIGLGTSPVFCIAFTLCFYLLITGAALR